jgi:LuxR family maltose regulon positive regulatory protein
MAAIRASIASLRGDTPRTIELARQALELLPTDNLLMRGETALSLGNAYLWSGELTAAQQALGQARSINQAASNIAAALSSVCSLGYLYLIQGHYQRAAEIFRKILDDATRQGGGSFPIVSMAHGGMGELLCEWYELEAAEDHLLQGIALGKQRGSVGNLVHAYMSLANVRQARGDIDGALALLYDVEQLMQQYNVPSADAITRLFKVRLELARDDVNAASRRIEESGFSVDTPRTFHSDSDYLTLVRVRFVQGRYEKANRLLEPLLQTVNEQEPERRIRTIIETLVLQALVLQAQNKTEQAITTLAQALSLAEPEGYVLTFVNEGQPMIALLLKVLDAQQKGHPALLHRISPAYIHKLLAALSKDTLLQSTEATRQGIEQPLVEPLSARELEVLQRIAAGKSNQAIAQEFIISLGTIKTHINNIYGKLNVHSRTQAIARARELHLL